MRTALVLKGNYLHSTAQELLLHACRCIARLAVATNLFGTLGQSVACSQVKSHALFIFLRDLPAAQASMLSFH